MVSFFLSPGATSDLFHQAIISPSNCLQNLGLATRGHGLSPSQFGDRTPWPSAQVVPLGNRPAPRGHSLISSQPITSPLISTRRSTYIGTQPSLLQLIAPQAHWQHNYHRYAYTFPTPPSHSTAIWSKAFTNFKILIHNLDIKSRYTELLLQNSTTYSLLSLRLWPQLI